MGATSEDGFSGADYAIYEGLKARGELAGIYTAPVGRAFSVISKVRSFRFPREAWRGAWMRRLIKTPDSFRSRSRVLDARLRSHISQFDVVLQTGGLFAPFVGPYPKPVAIFCDYTTRLAEIHYPPWFGLTGTMVDEWYALETELYKSAALLLTASENTRRSLIEHFGVEARRVRVVSEGVHAVHPDTAKQYDERTILFVGLDFDRKGGPEVLNAFAGLRETMPDAKLWIVGPPAGLPQPGVTWFGKVRDRARLEQLFASATVFVMPSKCEPFGLALIEAMSHGLPVVGSTADAMSEIVAEKDTGFLVAPGDVTALQSRMSEILASPQLARKLGTAGLERVRSRFLWSQTVDRVSRALHETVEAP